MEESSQREAQHDASRDLGLGDENCDDALLLLLMLVYIHILFLFASDAGKCWGSSILRCDTPHSNTHTHTPHHTTQTLCRTATYKGNQQGEDEGEKADQSRTCILTTDRRVVYKY